MLLYTTVTQTLHFRVAKSMGIIINFLRQLFLKIVIIILLKLKL